MPGTAASHRRSYPGDTREDVPAKPCNSYHTVGRATSKTTGPPVRYAASTQRSRALRNSNDTGRDAKHGANSQRPWRRTVCNHDIRQGTVATGFTVNVGKTLMFQTLQYRSCYPRLHAHPPRRAPRCPTSKSLRTAVSTWPMQVSRRPTHAIVPPPSTLFPRSSTAPPHPVGSARVRRHRGQPRAIHQGALAFIADVAVPSFVSIRWHVSLLYFA